MPDPVGVVSDAPLPDAAVPLSSELRVRTTSEQRAAAPPTTFWFAFWLAVGLVGTKAVHIGAPDFSFDGIIAFFRDLMVTTNADILFACGVGVVGQVALVGTLRWPRVRRVVWGLLILYSVVCLIFAVVSVQVFAYLQSPLTYPLIYLAGDVKNMRSSVGDFVSGTLVMAIVAVPVAYLGIAWATHRFIQPRRTTAFRLGQGLGVLVLGLYVMIGRITYAGPWSDRNDRRIAENPHWTLITSTLAELMGGSTVRLEMEFPPEDVLDFQTIGERGGGNPSPIDWPHRPRNAIVLVLESTSAQYLNIYDGPYPGVTPRLVDEAQHSLIFDNFYSHVGLTANAVVAIALGIYPGMTWREYTFESPTLPGTTAAQALRPHGYRTAFVHNGDLDYTNQRGFLENRGFDVLWDYRNLDCGVPDLEFSWGVDDRCLVDGILNWIDQDRSRPFFTLAWTIQVHHPYTLLPTDVEKIDYFQGKIPPGDDYHLDLYLNVLHEMDRQIGRLFDGLRERGLADDTLVIIVGDHGEAFGDRHDTYGHGAKLYDENIQVPLVLWNPKLFTPGRRSSMVGAQIDLNPTVLDVLGVPASQTWQGRSLFDPSRPSRAYFYAARDDYLLAVREGRWKYIYNATLGRDQLYDLDRDPLEQVNVAGQHREVCERLRQRLAAWMKYEEDHIKRLHQTD
ncbi:MAG: sulfatase-like hydrolase/transferase [Planctomycetes bacterium]|nr:sulfatase-like hydrolase/transferase [Planctomycetota bacterium]